MKFDVSSQKVCFCFLSFAYNIYARKLIKKKSLYAFKYFRTINLRIEITTNYKVPLADLLQVICKY